MKKAQDEVRSLISNKEKVVESDLDQLHYLKSIIKETIRFYPPGPLLLQRETIQDCKINDYDIPVKTRLLISTWAIGRDPNVRERSDEFYRDIFMNNSIDYQGHDFQFIPFGAGRRICPGMQSAILVFELTLVNLLYLFDWESLKRLSKENIDMSEAPGVTLKRKSALILLPKSSRCKGPISISVKSSD